MILPWGDDEITAALPDHWRLSGVLEPDGGSAVEEPRAAVRASLASPVGSPRLSDLVKDAASVALVVDDASRLTPVDVILSDVLEDLERAGVDNERVTLVTVLGVHRPMTRAEVEDRLGGPLPEGVRWENQNCDDDDALDDPDVTWGGTPVLVNKLVSRADVVISIGCIEPHIIAGFGGGYKNLVPGVAGRHTLCPQSHP